MSMAVPVTSLPPSSTERVSATPERLSVGVSSTVTAWFTQSEGDNASVDGAVRSILISSTVALAVFPARSAVDADAPRCAPSPVIVLMPGQGPSMPDSASAQFHSTATSLLYQPAKFGLVVAAPLIVGAVLSIERCATVVVAVLSALSLALPVRDWWAPSPSAGGALQSATPERVSAHAKLTMTFASYHPFALAARS